MRFFFLLSVKSSRGYPGGPAGEASSTVGGGGSASGDHRPNPSRAQSVASSGYASRYCNYFSCTFLFLKNYTNSNSNLNNPTLKNTHGKFSVFPNYLKVKSHVCFRSTLQSSNFLHLEKNMKNVKHLLSRTIFLLQLQQYAHQMNLQCML